MNPPLKGEGTRVEDSSLIMDAVRESRVLPFGFAVAPILIGARMK
jgi:hypothetical protein